MPGKLIVVSGPSGAGKSSLLAKTFERARAPLAFSVSATTRPPRQGEVNGRDYHFLSPAEFARRRERGEFLECFELFGKPDEPGRWYGTLRSEVDERLEAGQWVVLEIDVQGTMAVLEQFPDAATIFVRPASFEELERRLRARGTETEAALRRRLETARSELESAERYRHVIVNDDLDRAVERMCSILDQLGEGKS